MMYISPSKNKSWHKLQLILKPIGKYTCWMTTETEEVKHDLCQGTAQERNREAKGASHLIREKEHEREGFI